MKFYKEDVRITESAGNNALSYDERMALGSQGKLFIGELIDGTIDDVIFGENIVFEEVDNGQLISCKGLKNLVKISKGDKIIYITDNHNHALYFRYDALNHGRISKGATLLHVDQHADMNQPNVRINKEQESDMDYIAEYVNTETQIASFIEPALQSGLLAECVQIRSEAKLEEIVKEYDNQAMNNIILDIDMDFFAFEHHGSEKMRLLKSFLEQAPVVTIATSPYFIDQNRAISLIKQLLSEVDK